MEHKKLTLGKESDGEIASVCMGIADYTGWDVTFVRIAFLISGFISVGVMVYIACWICMPENPADKKT